MNVLGIDCSGELCSVALARDEGVDERSVCQPGEQLRLLLPMATSLLSECGVEAGSLHRIAVSVGPGSFTGLRLALTTARTMAQLLGIPVVPVSTLDVIGWGLVEWDAAARRACAMTDARKGQIFAACYEASAGALHRVGEYEVLDPGDAAKWLGERAGEGTIAGGTAFDRYGDLLRGVMGSSREVPREAGLPWARHVARAGRGDYGAVEEVGYGDVLPMYLRAPDVKKPNLPPLRALS